MSGSSKPGEPHPPSSPTEGSPEGGGSGGELERNKRLKASIGIVVAQGLPDNGSLTECNLHKNNLGVEGWTIIFNALRFSPSSPPGLRPDQLLSFPFRHQLRMKKYISERTG